MHHKPFTHRFTALTLLSISTLQLCSLHTHAANEKQATPANASKPAISNDEARSTLSDQTAVTLSIYNSNLALVKDQRKIKLNTGLNNLAIRDVSGQMRPETALLRSLSAPGSISLLEQNFNFDLLTPNKLLEKYVGKSVNIIKTNPKTGIETTEEATVLSANEGGVYRINDHIETGYPAGRIVYPNVPDNLRDRPTLVTQIHNKGAAEQSVELSYLTGGLNWKADYVAELNAKDNQLDLSGWVTLTNTSGASYRRAKLQLVAGDVNQVERDFKDLGQKELQKNSRSEFKTDKPAMSEESLLEYHLYTLERPTTIAENQTKQVALLSASHIPVKKDLVLRGADYYYQSSYGDLGQKLKVGVFVEFENKKAHQLGIPLPKGTLRVYKKDNAGNAQFVGEDAIDHTPNNETVRVKLGDAFDVTADKKQTDFKRLPDNAGRAQFESAYEFTLKNAKKERVVVTVTEPIPADWKILKENHPSQKATSNTAVWKIEIPAEGKTTLSYRVQVKY